MDVSENRGLKPPNHPILIGVSIINHPFWGTPIFGNTLINKRTGHQKGRTQREKIALLGGKQNPTSHLPDQQTDLSIPPTPTWAKWDQIPTDPVNSKLQSSYEMLRFFRGQWVGPLEISWINFKNFTIMSVPSKNSPLVRSFCV